MELLLSVDSKERMRRREWRRGKKRNEEKNLKVYNLD